MPQTHRTIAAVFPPDIGDLPCRVQHRAHEDHGNFSAGEPGDPKKPARAVNVKMFEGSGKMGLIRLALKCAEANKSVLFWKTMARRITNSFSRQSREYCKHAEVMRAHSNMEHDDPNAKRVLPYGNGELSLEVHQTRRIRVRLSHPWPL